VVNVGVIACRCYPTIAELDLAQGRCKNLILVPTPVQTTSPTSTPSSSNCSPSDAATSRSPNHSQWKFTRTDLDRVAQRLDLPASKAA
jgi:hypothetical protein